MTYRELVGGGILSKPTYDKYVRSGKIRVVQRGGNGREALIDYNSLTAPMRQACDSQFPDAMQQIKKRYMSDLLRNDSKAIEFYRRHELADGSHLTDKNQAEYVLNAQVMNGMIRVENEMKSSQCADRAAQKTLIWETVLGTCEKLRNNYQHTLPNNPARLREKYNAYKKEGYAVLISRKVGNQNTRKIGPMEGRLLLKLKRSKFPVYNDAQIFDEFNRQAAIRGLNPIKSMTTLRNYLYDPKVTIWWYEAVYGAVAFKNKYMPLFDTELPSMPNSLWYSDGTKLNLYYKAYDSKSKRMVARTTDVYEIIDACSEVFLGYYIADGENFLIQINAYRNALETWKVKPYEIVTDNQGGHKKNASQGFFKKLCHLHKTTMPHNGQSKSIESAFGRFQAQVLHALYNYTGQNITATKENSHVNVDLIMDNITQLPTLEELKVKYAECRQEWNNMSHPTSETGLTRLEMYTQMENPKAVKLDDYAVAEIFKLYSNDSIKYSTDGFCFDIDKVTYKYMVYKEGEVDMSFHLQNIGSSFRYRYDPQDMTSIELWRPTADGGLVYEATATPKVKIHRATQERTDEENAYLFKQLDSNKRTRAVMQIATEELMIEECMSEAYSKLRIPRPVGISEKEMEQYRDDHEKGKLIAPITCPAATSEEPELAEVYDYGISSVGEYTKIVSGYDDIDRYNRM